MLPSRDQELERYGCHRNDEGNSEYRNYINGLLAPLLERLPQGAMGLDFGCGPARIAEQQLRDKGISVSSFDPLFHNDTELLSRKYDFIFCSEVAEHFHHPRQEFDRLNNLLRQGGLLEIVTGLFREDINFQDWWYVSDFTHVVFLSEETLKWIAAHYLWNIEFRGGSVTLFRKG
jgi:2-polyprenyl-3-methyl-5-hydroxy-6-metoxy-1,4-benzoquinol methylase